MTHDFEVLGETFTSSQPKVKSTHVTPVSPNKPVKLWFHSVIHNLVVNSNLGVFNMSGFLCGDACFLPLFVCPCAFSALVLLQTTPCLPALYFKNMLLRFTDGNISCAPIFSNYSHLQVMCHFEEGLKYLLTRKQERPPLDFSKRSNKLNYPGLTAQKCDDKC